MMGVAANENIVEPPENGDWVITEVTTIANKEIVLNGNLIIENGGKLILTNITLKFNCQADSQYKIIIHSAGELEVHDSLIESATDYSYAIEIHKEGKFNVYNTTILDCTTFKSISIHEVLIVPIIMIVSAIGIIAGIIIILLYAFAKRSSSGKRY
jgi:hypothetical protein